MVKTAKAKKVVKTKSAKKNGDGGDIIDRDRYKYERHEIKLEGGKNKKVRDNGDRVAEALRGMTPDDVVKAVRDNGGEVKENWKNLNPGLRRLAAGNALRAIVRSGKTVEVGGKRVASLGGK